MLQVKEENADEEIREAFKVFDGDGNGFIDRQEEETPLLASLFPQEGAGSDDEVHRGAAHGQGDHGQLLEPGGCPQS